MHACACMCVRLFPIPSCAMDVCVLSARISVCACEGVRSCMRVCAVNCKPCIQPHCDKTCIESISHSCVEMRVYVRDNEYVCGSERVYTCIYICVCVCVWCGVHFHHAGYHIHSSSNSLFRSRAVAPSRADFFNFSISLDASSAS